MGASRDQGGPGRWTLKPGHHTAGPHPRGPHPHLPLSSSLSLSVRSEHCDFWQHSWTSAQAEALRRLRRAFGRPHWPEATVAANRQWSLLLRSLQTLFGGMSLTLPSPLRTLGNANHRCKMRTAQNHNCISSEKRFNSSFQPASLSGLDVYWPKLTTSREKTLGRLRCGAGRGCYMVAPGPRRLSLIHI